MPPCRWPKALAVKDGRILEVGGTDEILWLRETEYEVIDLEGRTVVPGFVDPHNHFSVGALEVFWPDCRTADSVEALQRLLAKAAVAPAGEWVRGVGYDHAPAGAPPSSPRRPRRRRARPPRAAAALLASPGVANSAALAAAGITRAPRPILPAARSPAPSPASPPGCSSSGPWERWRRRRAPGGRRASWRSRAPRRSATRRSASRPSGRRGVAGDGPSLPADAALRACTVDAARATGLGADRGSLVAGKRADFLVLSTNPLACQPEAIKDVQVLQTWVMGSQILVRP